MIINDPNLFTEYSNTMDDVDKDTHDFNLTKKIIILIVFDDMIEDIKNNKKFQGIVEELFIRCRKLNNSIAFYTQSYFSVPKDV